MQEPVPLSVPPMKVLSARLNGITLEILYGDILNVSADILVNAANDRLDHAGGLALHIRNAAGEAFLNECKDWIRQNGNIRPGEVAVTGAGKLNDKFAGIIHAVGPHGDDSTGNRELLVSAIVNSMRKACEYNKSSIAFPAISAGIYGFPKPVCAKCHIDAFFIYAGQIYPNDTNSSLKCVTFVLSDRAVLDFFAREVSARMDTFDFLHHMGMPEEKQLGIIYSTCSRCKQSFMLHHFQISLSCCVKVCDFCFYDNYTNQCHSCKKYFTIENDTYVNSKCRICYQVYTKNTRHCCPS